MDKKINVSYDICKVCLNSDIKDNWKWFCRNYKKDLDIIWKDKNFKCESRKPL